MIFKRILGNFLRMSQEFFAKTCIVISALSARNYAEIYQNPKSLYPAGYCPSLLQAHLYMVLFGRCICCSILISSHFWKKMKKCPRMSWDFPSKSCNWLCNFIKNLRNMLCYYINVEFLKKVDKLFELFGRLVQDVRRICANNAPKWHPNGTQMAPKWHQNFIIFNGIIYEKF